MYLFTQFRSVFVVPVYLYFVTYSKDMSAVFMLWYCAAFGDDTWTHHSELNLGLDGEKLSPMRVCYRRPQYDLSLCYLPTIYWLQCYVTLNDRKNGPSTLGCKGSKYPGLQRVKIPWVAKGQSTLGCKGSKHPGLQRVKIPWVAKGQSTLGCKGSKQCCGLYDRRKADPRYHVTYPVFVATEITLNVTITKNHSQNIQYDFSSEKMSVRTDKKQNWIASR